MAQQPDVPNSGSLLTGSGSIRVRAALPPDQIGRVLAQPASSLPEGPGNLIHIQLPVLCLVCYNLDAYQAPPSKEWDQPWPRAEYNICDKTPARVISVDKSQELLEAARGGCFYCTMIASALGGVQPGWDTESTCLEMFLAAGKPVIVRLEFGTRHRTPMGREQLLDFGVGHMAGHLIIGIGDTQKRPCIEVEIYRPAIPDSQLTIGHVAFAPIVQNVGYAEEIPAHVSDKRCFNFIKEQAATCLSQHKCGGDGPLPMLPDRVIRIEGNNASRMRLWEPKGVRAPFIALSYCWGPVDANTFLTNTQTFDARRAGMELKDLPPLFQDVVNIASALGIEYIWIDRLCIIQGDDQDFRSQAPKMGEIYGNATLTIAAASATSENDHIMVQRDRKWLPFSLNMHINGMDFGELRCRRLSHALGKEESGGNYGKISSRAWTWQERLLAARTVFFTDAALKFECRCHSVWEGRGKDLSGPSWSAQLDNMTPVAWTGLVEEFTARDITRPSDRLPAMDAVMKRIEKSPGWSSFWGLWTNAFAEGLVWHPDTPEYSGKRACRMNPGHYAPTWSWASIDGPISYISARPSPVDDTDPMRWDPECQSLNETSGLISVTGRYIIIDLHVKVEPNKMYKDNPSDEERLKYTYVIKDASGKDFTVKPDVALKRWSGNIVGEDVSTPIRVQYRETPPEQSWTAPCACLLVGEGKRRTYVLILGLSLREPGSFERLGLVTGISPITFSKIPRRNIQIA